MKGFSLIELLTVVAIIGLLSALGVNAYKQHTQTARSAEAKNALSLVWQSESVFKEKFGFYHENLLAIGAVPEGNYHYDFGFSKSATLQSTSDTFPLPEMLPARPCTNFHQICNYDCITAIRTELDKATEDAVKTKKWLFDYRINCQIDSANRACSSGSDPSCLKEWDDSGKQAGADTDTFKAIAIGKTKNVFDIWSITEKQTITNEN